MANLAQQKRLVQLIDPQHLVAGAERVDLAAISA
jgi:hypothetical protein